jgi:hypothetical protein
VITFESCSSQGMDLEAIGKEITDMKVAIGMIDHHSLQVETPKEVADHIRLALKHIPAERLVLSSNCGMGREGMARRHALYKMVSLVQGTTMVRKELGIQEAECIAADPDLTLLDVKRSKPAKSAATFQPQESRTEVHAPCITKNRNSLRSRAPSCWPSPHNRCASPPRTRWKRSSSRPAAVQSPSRTFP